MAARIFATTFSSLSDSLLAKVAIFLFTMIDRGIEHEDNNLAKYCDGDSCLFYRGGGGHGVHQFYFLTMQYVTTPCYVELSENFRVVVVF